MRVENSLKNMAFGLIGQLINVGFGFLLRTVFIYTLGIEYLGVEGLFTSILMMLSLANLGFDTAIIYSLYKPLAENDFLKVQALMNLFKKSYQLIGIIVLLMGILIFPFLPHLINGGTKIDNINIIYLLFLLSSVSSYYFVYKQSIIIADQHNHIISKVHSIFTILLNLVQIILLLILKYYIAILVTQLTFRLIENIYIANKADRLYPFLKEKSNIILSKDERNDFFKNLYALLLYKISGVVINGTDNILISKFVGLLWVGLYSNYLLVITTLNTFLSYVFYSVTASVGNLIVKENDEKKYFIFRVLSLANSWAYGFCTVSLWCLINPFITLWLGEKFTFNKFIVFVIILNFFTTGMQNTCTTFRDTSGMFKVGKYRPIFAAIINIVVSLTLVTRLGVAGVLLGTIISRLFTYFWYDPYVIFKLVFKKSLKSYYFRYFYFVLLVLVSALISDFVGHIFYVNALVNILLNSALCVIFPNTIFYLIFRKTEEYKYLSTILVRLLSKNLFKFSEKNIYKSERLKNS